MAPSSRDRISVDLHGLKAALFVRAQALGVSPSGLVRTTLAEALGRPLHVTEYPARCQASHAGDRVRISLRSRTCKTLRGRMNTGFAGDRR